MQQQTGFTLIETVVWIAVFTFAMLALTNTLLTFYKTNRLTIQEASAVAAAQQGIDTAVKAIRIASFSSNGEYPVVSIAPDQFTFYANVSPNDQQVQEVSLYASGTSFYESVIEPSGDPPSYGTTATVYDLADDVQNVSQGTSTFTYYDQSGNQITNDAQFENARFVVVNLIISVSTTSTSNELTLQSSAAMRNLIGN